jgi:hypothetical protein
MTHWLRCIGFGAATGVVLTLAGGYLVLVYGSDTLLSAFQEF